MKEIRIALEEDEYKTLSKKKGARTWKQVLMNGGGINGCTDIGDGSPCQHS